LAEKADRKLVPLPIKTNSGSWRNEWDSAVRKAYHRFVPLRLRTKIGKVRFERQEKYFKRHMAEFILDDTRKTDILKIFSLLKNEGYITFPEVDPLIQKKYATRKPKIGQDSNTGLFYVIVDGKKLFYERGLDEKAVRDSFNTVSLEQDYASPHRYFTADSYFVGVMGSNQLSEDSFGVAEGDIVVDAGAGEGNFALSVIDKASKVYIIEGDAKWCEALKQTFLPYKEKVEVIQKYLSDTSDNDTITLVDLVEKYRVSKIDFLKMDIEGYESRALQGGIKGGDLVDINKMAICVYHNPEDEGKVSNFMSQQGYKFYLTKGYIVFSDSKNPPIRKAVLRAYR